MVVRPASPVSGAVVSTGTAAAPPDGASRVSAKAFMAMIAMKATVMVIKAHVGGRSRLRAMRRN
jgi:hypothetical protein